MWRLIWLYWLLIWRIFQYAIKALDQSNCEKIYSCSMMNRCQWPLFFMENIPVGSTFNSKRYRSFRSFLVTVLFFKFNILPLLIKIFSFSFSVVLNILGYFHVINIIVVGQFHLVSMIFIQYSLYNVKNASLFTLCSWKIYFFCIIIVFVLHASKVRIFFCWFNI